jgi:hypothetical protein
VTVNAKPQNNEQPSEQGTMFDLQYSDQWPNRVTGLVAKDLGVSQALAANDIQEWKAQFRRHATFLAGTGDTFTSEDIIDYVGLPRDSEMNANNAVGAMMTVLAREGVIRKTKERRVSKRPLSHGREIAVWAGPSNIGET